MRQASRTSCPRAARPPRPGRRDRGRGPRRARRPRAPGAPRRGPAPGADVGGAADLARVERPVGLGRELKDATASTWCPGPSWCGRATPSPTAASASRDTGSRFGARRPRTRRAFRWAHPTEASGPAGLVHDPEAAPGPGRGPAPARPLRARRGRLRAEAPPSCRPSAGRTRPCDVVTGWTECKLRSDGMPLLRDRRGPNPLAGGLPGRDRPGLPRHPTRGPRPRPADPQAAHHEPCWTWRPRTTRSWDRWCGGREDLGQGARARGAGLPARRSTAGRTPATASTTSTSISSAGEASAWPPG